MNIIVEGLDRSGKSTIIKRLKREFPNMDVIHYTVTDLGENQPKNDILIKQGESIYNQIKNHVTTLDLDNNSYIFDRFIHSDAVLGPVYKNSGDTPTTREDQNELELYMNDYNSIIVWCTLSDKEFHKSLLVEEGTNEFLLEHYDEICQNYVTVMDRVKALYVLRYDWKDGKWDEDTLIEYIKGITAMHWHK